MNRVTANRNRPTAQWAVLGAALVVLAGWGLPRAAPGAATAGQTTTAPSQEITVTLKEIPVWEVENARVRDSFLRGQYTVVQKDKPPAKVKYPEFTSDSPWYGQVSFSNVAPDPRSSRTVFFALDSSVKGGDYNLLYFDDNRDADLTNDKLRRPGPESDKLARRSSSPQETFFEPVQVAFRSGQTLDLLPCLRIYGGSDAQFSFIAARVHTGGFTLDSKSYQALIGYQYNIEGTLDRPSTKLTIAPLGEESAYWWGGDQLNATHLLGGRYYRFSCTPAGDKLTVLPYDGPLGVFEVGAGTRKIKKLSVQGSLQSKESAVAIGDGLKNGWPQPTRQCKIPVGDYYPAIIHVEMGSVQITVSNNYHTNAQGQPRTGEPVAGIAIRADKPYVLDFSNKPVVVFEQPKANSRARPGDEVRVEAVLVDPVLDVMIRGLDRSDNPMPAGQQRSLDPKVVITRANGEIVAEGAMPFG
jgi:hypothetical protein